MKLYSVDASPYAARVRVSIYAKKLPIEIVPPPASGMKSAEYLAVNPIGKVPVLVLDDGVSIPESETIVEYLEDAFPDPPLRPHGPEARARVRLVARVVELYVMGPLSQLYPHIDPGARDLTAVDEVVARIDAGFGHLGRFMTQGPFAAGEKFTTADGQVASSVFFVKTILGWVERPDVLAGHPRLTDYMETAAQDPVLAKVFDEMASGLNSAPRA
jgi:glutathione S-transferase